MNEKFEYCELLVDETWKKRPVSVVDGLEEEEKAALLLMPIVKALNLLGIKGWKLVGSPVISPKDVEHHIFSLYTLVRKVPMFGEEGALAPGVKIQGSFGEISYRQE